jgi:hypothetical protein
MPSAFSYDDPKLEGKPATSSALEAADAGNGAGRLFPASGYSLWEYANSTWVLKKCHCQDGYGSGSPPAEAGKYTGEIKRKACEPSSA